MKLIGVASFTALLGVAGIPDASASTWVLDPAHSDVGFSVKHLMISNVRGSFGKMEGTVEVDDKNVVNSKVDISVDTASIDTGVADRDKHLRSAEFFDVEKFPKMTFKSTKIQKAGNGLKVTGDLTIRGVTKSVVLQVVGPSKEIKDPWGTTKRGLSATATINRKDFGLTWNKALETGGVVVGDEVKIIIEAELNKKS